jgi:CheY-like chemotaxis protein
LKRQKNILWLDDDEVLKLIADQIFSPLAEYIEGYCFFTDGYSALSYLEECDKNQTFPDLLLVDIKMPGLDGYEFLKHYSKRFHSKYHDTQIYMLSSSIRSADMEKIKTFPFVNDYLIKPLSMEKIRELLESR